MTRNWIAGRGAKHPSKPTRKKKDLMKILVPVDGSSYSQSALAFVAARPFKDDAAPQVDVLNVQLPVPPRAGRAVGGEMVRSWHEAEANKVLKPAVNALRTAHLDPARHFVVGSPGVKIAEWADQHAVDLIVMGSHGHTALKGLLFGSVTQAVLASTTVPVLVLRAAKAPQRASLRVGIALDGSAYGEAAARYVIDHRQLFGPRASFALIHVHVPSLLAPAPAHPARPPASGDEVARADEAAFEAALAPVREQFRQAGLQSTEHRLVGNPGDEIARFAQEAPLDLLAMGSHGRGALTAALMGSVATRVAAMCGTPLLLVRQPHSAPAQN
jgi:nucleotide-binding universal stress UspA family protein